MVQLYAMNTPAICQIVKGEADTSKGVAVFAAMILSLVKFYGGTWSEAQIMDCAKVCYDEWYYISFAELSHFSKRAKTGYFGKIYGSFSPVILVDWISTYAAETDEKRGLFYSNRPAEWVAPENPVDPEQIKKLVYELEGELLIQKADEEIEYQKRRAEKQAELERYMQNQIDKTKNDAA